MKSMNTRLAQEEIEKIVERKVARLLRAVLSDPDSDLELRPAFEKKLQLSIASKQKGRLRNFQDIVATLS